MKLYAIYSKYNEKLKDEWFLPSFTGEFDLCLTEAKHCGGAYQTENFKEVVLEKSDMIIQAIKDCMGSVFVYSDTDVQFFRPLKGLLEKKIEDFDIVCQRDEPGKNGQLCAGFFVIKANKRTLKFWKLVHHCAEKEGREQPAFNRLLRRLNKKLWTIRYLCPRISFYYLPDCFFSGGTKTGKLWESGMELPVPDDIVLHHANWTVGLENKIAQLKYVRNIFQKKMRSNNGWRK